MPLDVLGRTRATLINSTSSTALVVAVGRRAAVLGRKAGCGARTVGAAAALVPGPIGLGNLCEI